MAMLHIRGPKKRTQFWLVRPLATLPVFEFFWAVVMLEGKGKDMEAHWGVLWAFW